MYEFMSDWSAGVGKEALFFEDREHHTSRAVGCYTLRYQDVDEPNSLNTAPTP